MKTLRELLELKQQRAQRLAALMAIMMGDGTIQARDLTQPETDEITAIRTGADALEAEIKNRQFMETAAAEAAKESAAGMAAASRLAGVAADTDTSLQKAAAAFSITRAIQQVASGKFSGVERELHQHATEEAARCGITGNGGMMIPSFVSRADAATPTAASNLIGSTLNPVMTGYQVHTPFQAMGAKMITGITGVQNFPIADFLAEGSYVAEAGTVPDIDVTVRNAQLSPRQVCASLPVTMLLKASAGPVIDQIAMETLGQAEGIAVSRAVVSGNGTTAPLGILAHTGIVNLDLDTPGAMTFAQLLKLKNSPGKNNARFIPGKRGWITNEDVREQLEALQHGTSGRFIWDYEKPDMLMGYAADTTTLMPNDGGDDENESAIIFGIWSNLFMANWAYRELVIDNVTVKGKSILNWYSFWDHAVASPKAFAFCRNIITSEAAS